MAEHCCYAKERGWNHHTTHCKKWVAGSSPEQIENDAMMSSYYENGGIAEDIQKLIDKAKNKGTIPLTTEVKKT